MSISLDVDNTLRDIQAVAAGFRLIATDANSAATLIKRISRTDPAFIERRQRIGSQRRIDYYYDTIDKSNKLQELDSAHSVDSRVRTSKEFETYKELQSRRLKLSNPSAYRTSVLQEKYGAFAVDAEQIEKAEQSAEANSYIDSLLNQKKYRDDQGRKKWGSNWDRVKLAEDKANTRAVIMNTLGLNKLTALMKSSLGIYASPFAAAYAGLKASDYMYKKESEAALRLYNEETRPKLELSDKGKAAFSKYRMQAISQGISTEELADIIKIWDKHISLAKFGGDPKLWKAASRLGIRLDSDIPFERFKDEVSEAIKRHGNVMVQKEMGITGNGALFMSQRGLGNKTYSEMTLDEKRIRRAGFELWKKKSVDEEFDKNGFLAGLDLWLTQAFMPDYMEFGAWNNSLDNRILQNRAKKKGVKFNTSLDGFWSFANHFDPFITPGWYENLVLSKGLMKFDSLNPATTSPVINIGDINVRTNSSNVEKIAEIASDRVFNGIINAASNMQ